MLKYQKKQFKYSDSEACIISYLYWFYTGSKSTAFIEGTSDLQ